MTLRLKLKTMKTISTSVKTGDTFTGKDGLVYTVGLSRKIDGKNKIEVRVKISETSCITRHLSTLELNRLIK